MNKKLVIGIVAILVILGAIVGYYLHQPVTKVVGSNNPDSTVYTSFTSLYLPGDFDLNGINYRVSSGNLTTGTTTVLAIVNPFNATATIDMFRMTIPAATAATGTVSWACGTSSTAFASPSAVLVTNVSVASSTGTIIENGVTLGNGYSANTSSNAKIGVGAKEYIVCLGTATYAGNALTDIGSQFAGTYQMRWTIPK